MTSIGDLPDMSEILDQMEDTEVVTEAAAVCEAHEPIPEIPPFELPEYTPLVVHLDVMGQRFDPVWDADRFCDRFCGIVRYCHSREKYYIWNGLMWEQDDTGKIRELCEREISDLLSDNASHGVPELLKHLVRSHTPTGIRDMMFFLEANRLVVKEDDLDSDVTRVNVANGVINLETVQYEAPNRDRFITRKLNVTFIPGAQCPVWLDHLALIFGNDQETVNSFKMIAGYSLLRMNPEQLFFILYGRGENGKSVTLNLMYHIIGEYARNADPRTFMFRRSDDTSVRSDIARLYGAHFVTAIESGEGVRLNEALLKAITGHDRITSRELYEKEKEAFLEAKIFFATNHEPQIRDTTHGMLRRIIKIPFDVQIPLDKRDAAIDDHLKAEAPGIFNWMLDGLREWYANGKKIKLSQKIRDSTAAFRDTIDMYREFFSDDVEYTGNPDHMVSKKELFDYFTQWHSDKFGEYPPFKQQGFSKVCNEHGISKDGRTKSLYYWTGIKHLTHGDRERKKRDIEDKDQKRKNQALEIALAIKNGKTPEEIDIMFNDNNHNTFNDNNHNTFNDNNKVDNHNNTTICDLHIQKGDAVTHGDAYPVKYQMQNSYKGLLEEHHLASPRHLHVVDGYSCSSKCGDAEQSKCVSDPSKCGRGVKI